MKVEKSHGATSLYFTNFSNPSFMPEPERSTHCLVFTNDTLPVRQSQDFILDCLPEHHEDMAYCMTTDKPLSNSYNLNLTIVNLTTAEVKTLYIDTDTFAGYPNVIARSWNGSILYLVHVRNISRTKILNAYNITNSSSFQRMFSLNFSPEMRAAGGGAHVVASKSSSDLKILFVNPQGIFELGIDVYSKQIGHPNLLIPYHPLGSFLRLLPNSSQDLFILTREQSPDVSGFYSLRSNKTKKSITMSDRNVYIHHHIVNSIFVNSEDDCLVVWTDKEDVSICFIEVYDHQMNLKKKVSKTNCTKLMEIIEIKGKTYLAAMDAPHWHEFSLKFNARLISIF